jgi:hypothetical protein
MCNLLKQAKDKCIWIVVVKGGTVVWLSITLNVNTPVFEVHISNDKLAIASPNTNVKWHLVSTASCYKGQGMSNWQQTQMVRIFECEKL